jgi:hypothetical protein
LKINYCRASPALVTRVAVEHARVSASLHSSFVLATTNHYGHQLL